MGKEKIMIIEDDMDQVKGLGMRLKMNGYDVVVAYDAITAMGAIRKENPDLILLDIGLPGGDGFQVLKRIKDMMVTFAPIIVLSGRDPERNRERAIAGGATAFFQKPADNNELLATIKNTLDPQQELSG